MILHRYSIKKNNEIIKKGKLSFDIKIPRMASKDLSYK